MSVAHIEDHRSLEAVEEGSSIKAKGVNLHAKLAAISLAVGRIPKLGRNDFHKYDFVRESDIVDAVKRECYNHNVSLRFSTVKDSVERLNVKTSGGKDGTEIRLWLRMHIVNCDEPAEAICEDFPGEAQDTGDKALWKAMTGAKKYATICTFNISTGDDPEHAGAGDGASDQRGNNNQQNRGNNNRNQPQRNNAPPGDSPGKQLHDARANVSRLIAERKVPAESVGPVWIDFAGTAAEANPDWKVAPLEVMRGFYGALNAKFPAQVGGQQGAAETLQSNEPISEIQILRIEKMWAHLPESERFALVVKHTGGKAKDIQKTTIAQAKLVYEDLKLLQPPKSMEQVQATPVEANRLTPDDELTADLNKFAPRSGTSMPPAQEKNVKIDAKIIEEFRGLRPAIDIQVLCDAASQASLTGMQLRDIVKKATNGEVLTKPTYDEVFRVVEELKKRKTA